ncbi:MFS transporter [Agromyces italicus]|uniref:MFS transporter n=1 Tax=Agromyces italicus TaxID=279572 RepID=UPI0003B4F632|nr:MFS transporter [Agromyces italicus]
MTHDLTPATLAAEAAGRGFSADARTPLSRWWFIGFGGAWFAFWLLMMLPGQYLIVKLASILDPAEKVGVGSFLIAETGVVVLLAVPVIGWLCDRSNPRFGRRRSWALGGFVVASVPFALVGAQVSWQSAAVLLGVVALGQSAVLVSLSAMIADQVPIAQRGRASAAMGIPQVIALAGGMLIVTELVTDVAWSWAVIAMIALAAPLPFLLGFREPVARARAETDGHEAALTAPRRGRPPLAAYRDFGWVTVSRVLVNAGNLVGTTYLLFFLSDALGLPDAEGALMSLILVYLVASGLASWAGGRLTDRFRSRRVLVAISAGLQAAAALVLAFVPSWPASIVAAVLLGLGYGLFLAVDQALLTDVLPDERTRARDLGIVNAIQHLPIAPLIGWAALAAAGFSELYVAAAVVILLGGLAVFRVRSVR